MQYLDNYLVMLLLGVLLGMSICVWALAEWR